jgi:hypothetical protein
MMVQAFKPITALASETKREPPAMRWVTVLVPVIVTVAALSFALLIAWMARGQG